MTTVCSATPGVGYSVDNLVASGWPMLVALREGLAKPGSPCCVGEVHCSLARCPRPCSSGKM